MSLAGDLDTFSVWDLLGWLARRRATGSLRLTRGPVEQRFELTEGRVVLASSSEEETRLGRLLLDRGLVGEAELAGALVAGQAAQAPLGAMLARAGVVSRAAVAGVLLDKTRALIEDAIAWTDGRFSYEDGPPPTRRPSKRPEISPTVELGALLAQGAANDGDELLVADADVLEVTELSAAKGRSGKSRPRSGARRASPTTSDDSTE
jgi:hypothetical protein